jgi:hypothetical protein
LPLLLPNPVTMPSDERTYAPIDLGDVTPHNIKLLKKVNAVAFPVVYHDKFYKDVLDAGELAKLAFYNDIVVGAVCCRVDVAADTGERKLYIMTLGKSGENCCTFLSSFTLYKAFQK